MISLIEYQYMINDPNDMLGLPNVTDLDTLKKHLLDMIMEPRTYSYSMFHYVHQDCHYFIILGIASSLIIGCLNLEPDFVNFLLNTNLTIDKRSLISIICTANIVFNDLVLEKYPMLHWCGGHFKYDTIHDKPLLILEFCKHKAYLKKLLA